MKYFCSTLTGQSIFQKGVKLKILTPKFIMEHSCSTFTDHFICSKGVRTFISSKVHNYKSIVTNTCIYNNIIISMRFIKSPVMVNLMEWHDNYLSFVLEASTRGILFCNVMIALLTFSDFRNKFVILPCCFELLWQWELFL